MKQKIKKVIWGVVILTIGVCIALNVLGVFTEFHFFSDGWWTLFIIVPCTISLFTTKDKFGNIFGILIGVGLFLAAQEVITYKEFGKLVIPVLLILLGIYIIFRAFIQKPKAPVEPVVEIKEHKQTTGKTDGEYTTMFSGDTINFNGQPFEGTSLTALFGGIECDLRGAVITHDVVISASAIFGGIDIFVPANVRVKIGVSASFFGGVSDKSVSSSDASAPCITIRPTCVFGGVEIK